MTDYNEQVKARKEKDLTGRNWNPRNFIKFTRFDLIKNKAGNIAKSGKS